MTNKNLFKLLRLVFIFSASIAILLSTFSMGNAKPFPADQVNLTVPSSISIQQTGRGELVTSDFTISNKTPVNLKIHQVNAEPVNGWSLDTNRDNFGLNNKHMIMALDNNPLKNGQSQVDIPIGANSKKTIDVKVGMSAFDYKITEQAFNFTMDYQIVPTEFAITVINKPAGPQQPIKAMCGEMITLPKVDLPNFKGWMDRYTGKILGETMEMPIGGTIIIAVYKKTVFDLEKFKVLPFLGTNETDPKSITGLTIKYGHPKNLDFQYWDVSKTGDKSIICYRESQDSSSSQYNNIVVAADERELEIEGNPYRMFYVTGLTTPLKYFRSDGLKYFMHHGSLDGMFEGCDQLEDISGLANLKSNNINSMQRTFKGCINLKDYSSLTNMDFSKLNYMYETFYGCGINNADFLKNWNVSQVRDFTAAFRDCPNLTSIDLTNWNFNGNIGINRMFLNTPITEGYVKTQELADKFNQVTGVTIPCFKVKGSQ